MKRIFYNFILFIKYYFYEIYRLLCIIFFPILLISLFLHELGHAIACKYYKLPIVGFKVYIHYIYDGFGDEGTTNFGGIVFREFSKNEKINAIVTFFGPLFTFLLSAIGIIFMLNDSSIDKLLGFGFWILNLFNLIEMILNKYETSDLQKLINYEKTGFTVIERQLILPFE